MSKINFHCQQAAETMGLQICENQCGKCQDTPAPNVADLGEVPEEISKWIDSVSDAIWDTEGAIMEPGELAKKVAIAMYHKMREASTSKIHSIWNHIANELDEEITQLKDAHAESRNDAAVFKEWWDQSRVDIATLTEQRDANAQEALSYMERLTAAEVALFQIVQKSERLLTNPNCREIAEIAEGVLKEKIKL